MVKKLDAIKIYEIAESGNTAARRAGRRVFVTLIVDRLPSLGVRLLRVKGTPSHENYCLLKLPTQ